MQLVVEALHMAVLLWRLMRDKDKTAIIKKFHNGQG
jgi:hypothetical protein